MKADKQERLSFLADCPTYGPSKVHGRCWPIVAYKPAARLSPKVRDTPPFLIRIQRRHQKPGMVFAIFLHGNWHAVVVLWLRILAFVVVVCAGQLFHV